jgi:hypothetical protein
MQWDLNVSYECDGRQITSAEFGSDYLAEFLGHVHRVSDRSQPLSILEWGSGLMTIALVRNRSCLEHRFGFVDR